jgi:hypothetical protein
VCGVVPGSRSFAPGSSRRPRPSYGDATIPSRDGGSWAGLLLSSLQRGASITASLRVQPTSPEQAKPRTPPAKAECAVGITSVGRQRLTVVEESAGGSSGTSGQRPDSNLFWNFAQTAPGTSSRRRLTSHWTLMFSSGGRPSSSPPGQGPPPPAAPATDRRPAPPSQSRRFRYRAV